MAAKNILIVEDNEINLTLMTDIVRRIGHNTIEARDAESALIIACEILPDLILMDIRLPGMDGLEATKILKSTPETKHIPVLAVSASAFERDRRQALAAGCDTYITKPLSYDEFVKTVQDFLNK
jgi:CheY-like chemotaxis protein